MARPRRHLGGRRLTSRAPPDDPIDRFAIDPAAGPAGPGAGEPRLPADPIAGPLRLDPRRAGAGPAYSPARARRTILWRGAAASLVLHLLPLLALLSWPFAPPPPPPVIPVQLVLQPLPPPPPKPKAAEAKPPPGPLASVDMGKPEAPHQSTSPAPESSEDQTDRQLAAAMALPLPPAPALAVPEEKPIPPSLPARRHPIVARPPPRPGRVPGPAATRDEYLAYCASMIARYYDMLSPVVLAGRRGTATLTVVVLDDGTIARIDVRRSSGWRDIDGRIEQMVAAVRRFPPLPQWIQGPSVTLEYVQSFPVGMSQP